MSIAKASKVLKVVFDSNIYISALFFGGVPERLLRYVSAGKFVLYTSPDILNELAAVLTKKFKYSSKTIDQVIEVIKTMAIVVRPTDTISVIVNWLADNRILECAIAVKADYLVTGDKKHLLPLKKYESTKTITTQEFLQICEI